MDVPQIYSKFTKGKKLVSATSCGKVLTEPYVVYCHLHVNPKYKDLISDYQKILFERGNKHEEAVVTKEFPDMKPLKYKTLKEGFKLTLKAMEKGAKAIHGGPLLYLPEGLYGEADLIIKDSSKKSKLGNYHYRIQEIKVAKNIKQKHFLQAAFYNYILGKIQGYTPETFHVINRDNEAKTYNYNDIEPILTKALKLATEIARGKVISPTYNSDYPWNEYSKKQAIKAHDLTLIGGLGQSAKTKLNEAGYIKMEGIASADHKKLEEIKDIGVKTAHKFIRSAQAIISKKHIVIKKPEFKDYKTEIFLDLEGTDDPGDQEGIVQIDYLIGILVREKNKSKYIPFIAEEIDKEYKMWKEFLNFLKTKKDWVIYHWHNYEKKHIKQLIERHGCPQQLQKKMMGDQMIDLFKVATSCVAFPTYSNSLKDIGPFCGFKWRQKDVDAMESIALYLKFLETKDKKKLQKVIDYNEDDCIATMVIKDWLAKIK